ncbi:helicase-related protein [Ruminococcus bicirculans (ex Wegman et al. 2014)]|mgnify:FL=1|uniref:helicase-related protein n=1 Tax=Ruminococcus bicirculans (ex Wegman et al. 2014) TaxID=1160721 RepID=UPI0039A2AC88
MDTQMIISSMNFFLHEASKTMLNWLNTLLPMVTDNWWDECVKTSLTFTQHEIAIEKGYSKLSDFDLAALLRIANKSWYNLQTVMFLPSHERETVRKMISVRNNWAHCITELPGKDVILQDLNILLAFTEQFDGGKDTCDKINRFIDFIEQPDSLNLEHSHIESNDSGEADVTTTKSTASIHENSLVYLVSDPKINGVVMSLKNLGDITQYNVFVNNEIKQYYTGQIALVEKSAGYNWISLTEMRSYLTAYQINNPSSQNLYSLNSARIDFVPYQFRPALKMIHADEPRILIADSVGVGKTIEAGLIIKELEARSDLERVLVICPKPLVAERKLELEMKRFDEEFIPLDGATLRQIISDTDRDGDWPVRFNKAIIPYSILDSKVYNGEIGRRNRIFGLSELDPEPHFDLVIVDEAHHIRNGSDDKEKAFAYKCTKYFCDHADAVVMLTATPLQTSDNDLFTLLNVLRPDIVVDKDTFEMMSRPNANISRAVHLVRAMEEGWNEKASTELLDLQKTQWGDNVIAENPLYNDILRRLESNEIDREERVKLISDIESLHSFGTMLNRTRRRDIQDFCVRRSHTVSTSFTEYQQTLHDELLYFEHEALSTLHNANSVAFMISTIRRQAASCIFGLAPYIRDIISRRLMQLDYDPDSLINDVDEKSLNTISSLAKKVLMLADKLPEKDPKFEETYVIIRKKQEQSNNKIMIFSTFRHTLSYLKRKLSECGLRVEQIDGSVKDDTRYELKSRFELSRENEYAIDILLFTEVGSEGLDYQFCDMMINYDLPWNPMKIEQRIGRIDRRGQLSDVVNIYNIITEGTVDADIYHRCLMRIGVFERSIGDCEEILGQIASGIDYIVYDTNLTDEERNIKLEQMADNEVRKMQELNRLEEEEKELFGFDLTELTTSHEIKKAESPWISGYFLQKLIENYITAIVGKGQYIIGESSLKTIRLSASARQILRDDLKKLTGGRNALRRSWQNYLSGNKPNHSITFDPETASKERDSFFITAMHPLAKQAAKYYSHRESAYLHLQLHTSEIPSGQYVFSVYAWQYTGYNTYTKLITVCENEKIAVELPFLLEDADSSESKPNGQFNWSSIENHHVSMWLEAREKHKSEIKALEAYKLESITNTFRNRIRSLEQQIKDAYDENIKRMRQSELDTVREKYSRKITEIKEIADKADVLTTLLVNGVITIMGD